ncbi:hypothetical protein MIND_00268700 [Mycena indigotica]|uniref:Uncharacterized protein n=1 Tax=Mycena indigotica TaxID=2126181 RepID=A0A8H6T7L9_9AGAR|nr:uncharacterized protein MIND_00268700 [Mycena indigotica]KAF7312548.1 hypothetical protein MIND_00268700 [Mycena indigotica]
MSGGTQSTQQSYYYVIRGISSSVLKVRCPKEADAQDLLQEILNTNDKLKPWQRRFGDLWVYKVVTPVPHGLQSVEEIERHLTPETLTRSMGPDELGLPDAESAVDFVIVPREAKKDEDKEPDSLEELPRFRLRKTLRRGEIRKAPSEGSKSLSYKNDQGNPHILDGRCDVGRPNDSKVGPPIEIFHGCFDQFRRDIQNLKVPPEKLVAVVEFIHLSSAIYSLESQRYQNIHDGFYAVTGLRLLTIRNEDKTYLDGIRISIAQSQSGEVHFILIVREDENEIGTGSSAPDVQAALFYLRSWSQSGV